MRAKLDESLPNEAAEVLRTAGWDCDTVHDEGLGGADDERIAANRIAVLNLLARALPVLDSEWTDRRLWIVEPSRIRMRGSGESTV